MIKQGTTILLLFIFTQSSFAQFDFRSIFTGEVDTLYYDELPNHFTAKFFTNRKFSDFSFDDNLLSNHLEYNSNTNSAVGFGMSYKWLGVNLGYAFGDANESTYGKTKRFDFQTHVHLRKLTFGFYTSRYQGYYLENSYDMINDWPQFTYYIRGDIKKTTVGLSASYVFNSKKYSNRATFLQNEWQKKSAGSLITGFSVFYDKISADSSFVPSEIKEPDFYRGEHWDGTSYFGLGANVGYVFTWVVAQHFFLNLGLSGGLATGRHTYYPVDESKIHKFRANLNLISSSGFGYNSERFYVGFSYASIMSTLNTPIEQTSMNFSSGRSMFVMAYRFRMKEGARILPRWIPVDL